MLRTVADSFRYFDYRRAWTIFGLMNRSPTVYAELANKPHFEMLDGLRGLAALAVVVFHFMEWMQPNFSKNFIAHGFLAVDFFFCLSGFVIGYAYDNRMGQMGALKFFKARIIRLHPLIVLGSSLGLFAFLFDPFGHSAMYPSLQVLILYVCSILLIPYPTMEERAFNLFGLNAPTWSLFWEYIANILYALILCRLGKKVLLMLCIIGACLLFNVAYRSGNLLGGWDKKTFWDGGARVFYSFLAGLVVYRFDLIVKNRLGVIGMCILLLLAFLMPFGSWNWWSEPLLVTLYFPLIIALGAGTTLRPFTARICNLAGSLSYPLYMTHYAVMWMFGSYLTRNKPNMVQANLIMTISIVVLIGFAYGVMVLYDAPLRKYLRSRQKA